MFLLRVPRSTHWKWSVPSRGILSIHPWTQWMSFPHGLDRGISSCNLESLSPSLPLSLMILFSISESAFFLCDPYRALGVFICSSIPYVCHIFLCKSDCHGLHIINIVTIAKNWRYKNRISKCDIQAPGNYSNCAIKMWAVPSSLHFKECLTLMVNVQEEIATKLNSFTPKMLRIKRNCDTARSGTDMLQRRIIKLLYGPNGLTSWIKRAISICWPTVCSVCFPNVNSTLQYHSTGGFLLTAIHPDTKARGDLIRVLLNWRRKRVCI